MKMHFMRVFKFQILLREKSGDETYKKQYWYSSCHLKQQMTSIALMYTTANSFKADTTRVFEEVA